MRVCVCVCWGEGVTVIPRAKGVNESSTVPPQGGASVAGCDSTAPATAADEEEEEEEECNSPIRPVPCV